MNAIRRCRDEDAPYLASVETVGAWSVEQFRDRVTAESDPAKRRALYRARFRTHVREFARFCLPDSVDMAWDDYAATRLDRVKDHWKSGRPTTRTADAAPRGIAKSTTERIDALHDICYGLERYIVVAMASHDDAIEWSECVFGWLKEPTPQIAWLYGPFKVTGGVQRWRATPRGGQPCALRCVSFGGKIRGTHDGNVRPTKIVCDDAEDRKRVHNPKLRGEDTQFLTDDVLKAGQRQGGTIFRWVGTVLSKDAILSKMLGSVIPLAGWRARKWQAVITWPSGPGVALWTEYQRIYSDLRISRDPELRQAVAARFYDANRAAMDEGVIVLNPAMMPIDRVYRIICDEGWRSVNRELQNEDNDPTEQVFDSRTFRRCRVERGREGIVIIAADGRRVPLAGCTKTLRWDPALGTSSDGDFAAVVVGARDQDGYTYTLAVWMRRANPTEQLAAVWSLAEAWGLERGSLESNGFQRLLDGEFKRQQDERRAAGRFWKFTLVQEPSTTEKEERICAQEPGVMNGWHQFADTLPVEFLGQFDSIRPEGSSTNDDGPDAWEGMVVRLGGGKVGFTGDRYT